MWKRLILTPLPTKDMEAVDFYAASNSRIWIWRDMDAVAGSNLRDEIATHNSLLHFDCIMEAE